MNSFSHTDLHDNSLNSLEEPLHLNLLRESGLSVVIGTRNESECIEKVVKDYASVLSKIPSDTELVIADYSEDDTLDRAMAAGKTCSLKVVPLRVNRPGRGFALRYGVKHAKYNLFCLADGDGSHNPRYIPRLLEAYVSGSIVMASRFPPLGWSDEHTFFHYYGNRIAVAAVNLLFRANVSDVTNGFGIMSKDVWNSLGLDSDNWSFDTQIICRALKNGIRIIEIPSFEPKRAGGIAKLSLLDALWRIAGRVFLERITR
jgi:glycosyltransferase involved in cell wall biosynthesis